ncbi:urease accessory protein UreH domain-containing protein [Plebeiibacterium sediminum]|uniref:Sulfite exporter TauE/SafE family protein n=1 Tax=Plebeiibacterium sediminum TaxID=2992112 RepID=A0AAE3M3C7_9BACT|nr:sulfite exporter TauE/SafE family protein [Plebeiobacterium sediminum]MCW3786057.1 sulfite exporter TauE/SafE family protein [Plebeiobacterium sediminum]
MTSEVQVLMMTAAGAGFIHTVLGPDHYLPFILIGKARKWNLSKVLLLTLVCGIGHIIGSLVLGVVGVFMGIGLDKLEFVESVRGSIAAWALIAFGLVYAIWGLRKALKNKSHSHTHFHSDGTLHHHTHNHINSHSHVHESTDSKRITPWVLFIIFVLGPCEVLIPLLMYPAAQYSLSGVLQVTLVFGITTIVTMLGVVLVSSYGIQFIPTKKLGLYTHFIAGIMVFMSGVAIQVLGI